MTTHLSFIHPKNFAKARGYAHGVRTEGALIHVGGQVGWNAQQEFESESFVAQFAQALDNVLAVVHAGGGKATSIASMTIYVTDLAAYRAATKEIGTIWQERLGKHYPTIALVGVAGLVEQQANVEIQALAVVPTLMGSE